MKILLLSRAYPTEKYPLMGIFEYDQATALVSAGHEVLFAAVDLRSIRRWRKWGVEHFWRDGVEIYAINLPVGRVPVSLQDAVGKWALGKLYRRIEREQGRPDIMHAHFLAQAAIAADLSRREGLPLVVTEHSSGINRTQLPLKTLRRAQKAYGQAAKVVAVSGALRDNLQRSTGITALVIPNIVAQDTFLYRGDCALRADGFRFVSTGNLVKSKGFDTLLYAFAALLKQCPRCSLAIYGGGPEQANLAACIHRLNLDAQVTLMGQQPRTALAEAYAGADAFVLASHTETFGVAYIEAMAAGLPVIATRCGGPEDFVTPGTGLLIPVNDVAVLTGAMAHMVLHAAEYDREKIAAYVRAHFSPDHIAAELTALYGAVLTEETA